MGMTRPNGGGCTINAETGVGGDGGRQSRLSGTLHMIRRVRTQGNHTLDGSPGIKQCNFIWPSWEFCGASGHCSERGHLVRECIFETGRLSQWVAGKEENKAIPWEGVSSGKECKIHKDSIAQRMPNKQIEHLFTCYKVTIHCSKLGLGIEAIISIKWGAI